MKVISNLNFKRWQSLFEQLPEFCVLVLHKTCNFLQHLFLKYLEIEIGLTTLLSIFLFLIHLFIGLNVTVYILMIYKRSKIRAWYAWLNIKETQTWKVIGKYRESIFLDCTFFFSFLGLALYKKFRCRFLKFIAYA